MEPPENAYAEAIGLEAARRKGSSPGDKCKTLK